jgi:hypothetical protein
MGALQLRGLDEPKQTIVFHGGEDKTVHLYNSDAITPAQSTPKDARHISEVVDSADHTVQRDTTFDDRNRVVLEKWIIAGLGRTWSGGRAEGSYPASKGLTASAAMVRFFFEDVLSASRL